MSAEKSKNTALALTIYVGLTVGLSLVLPKEITSFLFSESGPFEIGSVIFWAAASWLFFYTRKIWDGKIWAHLCVLCLVAAVREIGTGRIFSNQILTKLSLYFEPNIHFGVKIQSIILVAIVGLSLCLACYRGFLYLKSDRLKSKRGVTLSTFFVIFVVVYILDSIPPLLRKIFDYSLPSKMYEIMFVLEESLEMTLPLLCIVAITQKMSERK